MRYRALSLLVHAATGGGNVPLGDDAGTQQQFLWTGEALGWDGVGSGHMLTTNFADTFGTGTLRRRTDRVGTMMKSWSFGPAGPSDLVIRFPTDPSDKMVGEFAYTELDEATNTYVISIRKTLGDPSSPPPYNTKQFFLETLWHELGHVVLGLLMESFGEGYVRSKLAAIFGGGSWNTGRWETHVLEAACETWKDWMFSGRQFNNRTVRKLPKAKWEKFGDLMIQTLSVPGGQGPIEPNYGTIATDLILDYSADVDRFPRPAPDWDWNQLKKKEYDYPIAGGSLIDHADGVGFSWLWGGRGGGAPNTGQADRPLVLQSSLDPTVDADSYLKPPPPGSKVKFRCRWDDPLADVFPKPYRDLAASNEPSSKPLLPPGVLSIDTGGPQQTAGFPGSGLVLFGPIYARDHGGIVWAIGTSGGPNSWDRYEIPEEIARVTWREYDALLNGIHNTDTLKYRYEPIYFDMRSAREFEIELTVPDHGGELALIWSWLVPGFSNQNNIAPTIREPFPVRCYPSGFDWATYPKPKAPALIEFPQGNVQLQEPDHETHGVQHIVVGDLRDAIPLIDPDAEGVEIIVQEAP